MTTLVWLQRDLRLSDHAPLKQALQSGKPVVISYFHDPKQTIGSANSVWLAYSLLSLQQAIRQRGGELLILEGQFDQTFSQVLTQYQISQVFYHYEVGEPFLSQQQLALNLCKQHHVALKPYDQAWFPAEQLHSQKGDPYSVFTPFYKKMETLFNQIALPLSAPNDLSLARLEQTFSLPAHLSSLIEQPWAQNIIQHWQIGEHQAWLQYQTFIEVINAYPERRDFPAETATSRLSVHLHFGELSSRELFYQLQHLKAHADFDMNAIQGFIRQLAWREFARYLLYRQPELETQPYQVKFSQFPWAERPDLLKAWQQGETGIPIIDAGMKQLWHTGWMHNRVRMLVASWLTKNANIDWRLGQAWFADTLIDADPANNAMGWQWVAGCGVDAAPYYRLFNPVLQSEKFDPQGHYIKQWIPQLKPVAASSIHAPWKTANSLDPVETRCAMIYAKPKIDLAQSREEHLQRLDAMKHKAD